MHPKIVGYAFSERIDTPLMLEALYLAIRRHKPPKGLFFTVTEASSAPLEPFGRTWGPMEFSKACPARGLPTTML